MKKLEKNNLLDDLDDELEAVTPEDLGPFQPGDKYGSSVIKDVTRGESGILYLTMSPIPSEEDDVDLYFKTGAFEMQEERTEEELKYINESTVLPVNDNPYGAEIMIPAGTLHDPNMPEPPYMGMKLIPTVSIGIPWRLADGSTGKFEWEDEQKKKAVWVPEVKEYPGYNQFRMGVDPVGPEGTGQATLFTPIPAEGKSFDGKESDKYFLDEFGTVNNPTAKEAFEILKQTLIKPVIEGQDILTIRTLTGNRRETAIKALYASTIAMLDKASPDCFFVPHDVRSSKNSKEIGRFKKRNKAGQLEDFTTLEESKAAKLYRKETSGYWLKNKVAFLNQTRGMKLPLKIEFTFIRETLRKFDYPNAVQILLDMMVEFGYMPDDETCYVLPVFNTVFYHNKMCGVLIKVIK